MDPTVTNLQIYPTTKTEPSTNSATAWRKWENSNLFNETKDGDSSITMDNSFEEESQSSTNL